MSNESFQSGVCLSFVQQEEIGKVKISFQENISSIYQKLKVTATTHFCFLLFPLSLIDPFHASVS